MAQPRLIRYLEDGVYKYASVKDVGNLELLSTTNKEDLVSAINELIADGGATQAELEQTKSDIIDVQDVINSVSTRTASLELSEGVLRDDLDASLLEIGAQKEKQEQLELDLSNKLDSTVYNTQYQGIVDDLKAKADLTAFQGVEGRVTTVESKTTTLEGEVATKISKTDFDGAVGVNKWILSRYSVLGTDFVQTPPSFSLIRGLSPNIVTEIDDAVSLPVVSGNSQITHLFTNIKLLNAKTVSLSVTFDDSIAVFLNGASVFSSKYNGIGASSVSLSLRAGWNTVEILHGNATGTPILNLGTKLSTQVDKLTAVIGVGDKNDTRLTNAETEIKQTADAITLKANQTDVTSLGNRVTSAEGQLTVQAGEIASKVSQNTFDAYSQRVSTAESTIVQHSNQIATKVAQTDFDNLNGRVDTAESSITQLSNSITLKASQETVDTLAGRVSTAESSLSVQSGQIATKVSQTDFDKLGASVGNLLNNTTVSGNVEKWKKGVVPVVDNIDFLGKVTPVQKATSAGNAMIVTDDIEIDPSKAYEVSLWMKSDGAGGTDYFGMYAYDQAGTQLSVDQVAISTQVVTATNNPYFWSGGSSAHNGNWIRRTAYIVPVGFETAYMKTLGVGVSNVIRLNASVRKVRIRYLNYNNTVSKNLWVANTKMVETPVDTLGQIIKTTDGINSRLSTAESTITQNSEAIALKVGKTEFDSLSGKVTSQESSITTLSNSINLKANATDVYTKTQADGKTATAITDAKAEIKLTTDGITQSVTNLNTEIDGIQTTVDSHSTQISQTANEISLNVVKKDNVITSINASTEGIKMVASKIDLVGAVTINDLDPATKAKVNNAMDTTVAYNGVKIDAGNGIVVTKSDNKSKAIMNATSGFKIQKSSDGVNFTDVFWADTNGVIYAKGLVIDSTSTINGTIASTVVTNANNGNTANTTITSNKSTWDRSSNINADGTLNVAKLNGQLLDTQISSASAWNSAKVNVDDIVSDIKVSPVEKNQMSRDWELIKAEYAQISAHATALGVTSTAYVTAYNNFDAITPKIQTEVLASMTTSYTFASTTARDNFKAKFATYYAEKEKLRKALTDKVNSTATTANTNATTANTTISDNKTTWDRSSNINSDGTFETSKLNGKLTDGQINSAVNWNSAKASVDDMMSDMKVTPLEKNQLSRDWEAIKSEYAQLSAQATAFAVSATAYTTAYNNLDAVTPRIQTEILASMTTTYTFASTTTRDTFKTQLNTYFSEAEKLRKALTDSVNTKASGAQTSINDMSSDMKVTPVEKNQLLRDWEAIKAEYTQLSSQATSLSVTATAYTNAYTALNGTTPRIELDVLASMSTTYTFGSTTLRDTFKTQINTYFSESEKLRKAISDKINGTATSAEGKIDNLSIGGRNLVYNSTGSLRDIKGTPLGWTKGTMTESIEGKTTLKVTTVTSGEMVKGGTRFEVKPNTQYALKALVKGNSSAVGYDIFFLGRKSTSLESVDYDYAKTFNSSIDTDKLTLKTWTFTTASDETSGYVRLDNNGSKLASAPSTAPTLALVANAGSTLTAGTYYVRYAWANDDGETAGSAEASLAVTAGNNLRITVPAFPAGATSAKVYVNTASGNNRYQSDISTSGGTLQLSTPIVTSGRALVNNNSSALPYSTTAPTLSLVSNVSTKLPTGTYFVRYTWADDTSETVGSSESSLAVTAGNDLQVAVPAFPAGVTSARIYIGTASGQNVYQEEILTSGEKLIISDEINVSTIPVPLANNVTSQVWFSEIQLEEGNRSTDWQPSLEELQFMIADTNDKLKMEVLDNLSTKVDSSELSNYATGGQLEQALTDVDKSIESKIQNIDFTPYASNAQLVQLQDEFTAKFQSGGGINLLKNSVGFAGTDFWSTTGTVDTRQNEEIDLRGSLSAFVLTGGTISQSFPSVGQQYTISALVKKGTAGTGFMKIYDGTTLKQTVTISARSYDYEQIQVTLKPTSSTIKVEFNGDATSGGTLFTSIMANVGELPLQWQHSSGEVYNTNVKMDINGIRVISNAYEGYTSISPEEFSGYAVDNTGTMQKVFTLNKDVTEMTKANVDDEIAMKSIKIIPITSGGYNGWAFIGD